jgi:dephospho-CoA kinase
MTAEHARERMAAQAGRDQRLAIADIVVDNSGTLGDLDQQVAEVWSVLHDLAGRGDGSGMSDPPRTVEK